MFHQEVGVSGLPSWVTLPLVFLVTAITMTGFGEITGRAFREFAALDAYRWDIIGSILGTLAFTLVSSNAFAQLPKATPESVGMSTERLNRMR